MKKIVFRIVVLSLGAMSFVNPVISATVVEPTNANTTTGTVPETVVSDAMKEFKDLSRKERKARIREMKNTLEQYKADKAAGKKTDDNTILLAILAILLPPLAVFLKEDALTTKFWISLILTLLFWIPGVIYSLLVVFDVV